MPDVPPLPISAAFNVAGLTWSVTFDHILQAGALDLGNWEFVASGDVYSAATATAAGNTVSGTAAFVIGSLDPDTVDYAPPPFDVLNLSGQPAAAFTDFPLVVT